MKQILTLITFLSLIHFSYGQDLASINSGSSSNNNLIYTVGEIFVIPANPDDFSSGIIGSISRIEFTSLGIDEIQFSGNLKLYPNPTSNSIFLELENQKIDVVFIYDMNGKLISEKKVINKQVSLKELQSGTYIIKTNNPNIKSLKVLKK